MKSGWSSGYHFMQCTNGTYVRIHCKSSITNSYCLCVLDVVIVLALFQFLYICTVNPGASLVSVEVLLTILKTNTPAPV